MANPTAHNTNSGLTMPMTLEGNLKVGTNNIIYKINNAVDLAKWNAVNALYGNIYTGTLVDFANVADLTFSFERISAVSGLTFTQQSILTGAADFDYYSVNNLTDTTPGTGGPLDGFHAQPNVGFFGSGWGVRRTQRCDDRHAREPG